MTRAVQLVGDPPAPVPDFIDVSMWQGAIRWDEVPHPAILKATEGVGYVDPSFQRNAAEARRHGLYVGAYHFLRQTSSGPNQAEHFWRTVSSHPAGPPLVLVLDWEKGTDGVTPAPETAEAFARRLEELTTEAGFHAAHERWVYGNAWIIPHAQTWGWDSWVAHYPNALTSVPALAADYARRGALALQYTSDGTVPGIDARCDLNVSLTPDQLTPAQEQPTMNDLTALADLLGLQRTLDGNPFGVSLRDRGDGTNKLYRLGDAVAHAHENTNRILDVLVGLAGFVGDLAEDVAALKLTAPAPHNGRPALTAEDQARLAEAFAAIVSVLR